MRSSRSANSSSSVEARVWQLLPPTDEKVRYFVDWWQRMHGDPQPLVAEAVKLVEFSEEGAAPQRFLWEVCRWPEGTSSSWAFVCWMIDGDGMWTRHFASKKEAAAYFEQSPAVVLAAPSQTDDEHPVVGVKVRRSA